MIPAGGLIQADERQNGQNDHDKADEIDDAVHSAFPNTKLHQKKLFRG